MTQTSSNRREGKWIQIIREILPQIKKIGLLYDLHLDQTQLKSGETTARNAGIETLRLGIDQPAEFRNAFQRAVDPKADAMLVHSSPIFVDQASAIAELGREFRLPSIGLFPIYAKAGGLVSYGPNNFELFTGGRKLTTILPAGIARTAQRMQSGSRR